MSQLISSAVSSFWVLGVIKRVSASLIGIFFLAAGTLNSYASESDWMHYGGHEGGGRYSDLTQINKDNVHNLEVAWTFKTGHLDRVPEKLSFLKHLVGFQVTPIILPKDVGGHLVLCTPFNEVIAIDPETGEQRWFYNPKIDLRPFAGRFNCRGLAQWRDSDADPNEVCRHSLFLATSDKRLISLDARTGNPCPNFGKDGIVDVVPFIKSMEPTNQIRAMQLKSPPAVVNGVVVIGGTGNKFKDASSVNGAVRGFDARTGKFLWAFDTLVRGEDNPGSLPYTVGGANVWTTMSVDSKRDLVFIPTASAAPNFYGALRPGDNRYANSVLAIKASTGELVWHYQTIHHDIWDWDLPTHPMLVDVTTEQGKIPIVIQLGKTGMVYTFHRDTGEPYFEIKERPVPTDGILGDQLSPTQPFPVKPPPLVRQGITPDDAWGVTPYEREACRKLIAESRYGGMFTPMSTKGTVMFPQVGGGANWGGGAFDPERNILVVPVSQVPFYVRLIPADQVDKVKARDPRAGNPMGPPGLIKGTDYGLEQKPVLSPLFTPCTAPPWSLLVAVDMISGDILWKTPFGKIDKLSPLPIGFEWGTPFAGGAITTAGGVVFIGATADERFRAFDVSTGKKLLEIKAPTSAMASPMTYMANGKQYVVIATGGHMWNYPQGISDEIIAYALPDN